MFDVSNWVASLNGENGPRGMTSHEALSVSPQGALEISSTAGQPPSLDRSHLCTPRLVAEPCKRDERLRPSSQRPQYPTLYRRLKQRLGPSLRTKFYTRSVVSPGKRASHKRPRIKSCLSGPETLQRPVSGPNSASCDGQLNCGGLHKQTRGNTLSGDVCTPVENHDLVPSFSHHIESQAHSRVSECDGRPTFQVESGTVDRMVTTSTGVQTDLPKVVHSPRGPIRHLSEPQASTVRLLSQTRRPTEIPLQLPVSTTLLKQSHNYVFHSNPQHLNLHAWCLGVDNSKNKASLWKWQRELLHLNSHQQGPSTNQSGPYLKNGAEKIRWISPLHL